MFRRKQAGPSQVTDHALDPRHAVAGQDPERKSAGDDRDRILWTAPKGPGRKHLVIRVSYDEAQTFRNEKTIYGGLAAYSDISILDDKTVGVIWERGVSENYQFVTFTRLNRDYLEAGPQ